MTTIHDKDHELNTNDSGNGNSIYMASTKIISKKKVQKPNVKSQLATDYRIQRTVECILINFSASVTVSERIKTILESVLNSHLTPPTLLEDERSR